MSTTLWSPGQPPPPWNYEYQYPVDCLRACWIIPAWSTGFSTGATPIYPNNVVIGAMPGVYNGPPIRFKVQLDEFFPVRTATVVNGGSGYAVGDEIQLPYGQLDGNPIGGPAWLRVLTAPGGVIATVEVLNQVYEANPIEGGSYFKIQANPIPAGYTTGSGIGATFNITQGSTKSSFRS